MANRSQYAEDAQRRAEAEIDNEPEIEDEDGDICVRRGCDMPKKRNHRYLCHGHERMAALTAKVNGRNDPRGMR